MYTRCEIPSLWVSVRLSMSLPAVRCREAVLASLAVRGTRGWGWYHRYRTKESQRAATPSPSPENLFPSKEGRPHVFFDIRVEEDPTPLHIVFELADDIVPQTVHNFIQLATTGVSGVGYRGSLIHSIRRNELIQGGDLGLKHFFADENFLLRHCIPGTLSMANCGVDTNTSQFILSLRACPHLDGRCVVFGKVIEGFDDLRRTLEKVPLYRRHPTKKVVVEDCGRVDGMI